MFLQGEWVDRPARFDVTNPFDGSVIDTVPRATEADVDAALTGALAGAAIMRKVPAYERYQMLRKASELMLQRQEELGQTISAEGGKVIGEARFEVLRSAQNMEVVSEEAKRLFGEVLPMDAGAGVTGKIGLTLRIPCGVVAAITPFNFPLNLVCHKVGPALAAGNAVVLKPASDTPLVALKLVEILLEAGVPPLAISCLTGGGGEIGDALCADRRVRKISFTGSRAVGEHICRLAGLKKVTMELGGNSPIIVMDDADLQKVAAATAVAGFMHAGQVCISAQRIIVLDKVYDDFLAALKPEVEAITVGDQRDERTRMGPMIREADAVRVQQWLDEAVASGARRVCGGERTGALCQPTVLADVQPSMRISRDELFGPAVAVSRAGSIDEAIRIANDTDYGLSAAIFTQNLDHAMRFAQEVDAGNIHINWGTVWRTDFMPYGGLKQSGFGKEGSKYAIEEMTEMKTVIIHQSV
jgi:glyceraldehyde-3-phosphate dehydrogenase (NADP+)